MLSIRFPVEWSKTVDVKNPDMDLVLKRSISLVVLGRGTDWSWAPQLASVEAWSLIFRLGIGKLMNDWMLSIPSEWYDIPKDFVPFRYFRTYLAAAR